MAGATPSFGAKAAPVPAILAFLGFVYVVVMRPKSLESIRLAVFVVIVGTILFFVRRRFGSHQSA